MKLQEIKEEVVIQHCLNAGCVKYIILRNFAQLKKDPWCFQCKQIISCILLHAAESLL